MPKKGTKLCLFCRKAFPIYEIEQHISTCPNSYAECDRCQSKYKKGKSDRGTCFNLDFHLRKECTDPDIKCLLCKEYIRQSLFNVHANVHENANVHYRVPCKHLLGCDLCKIGQCIACVTKHANERIRKLKEDIKWRNECMSWVDDDSDE